MYKLIVYQYSYVEYKRKEIECSKSFQNIFCKSVDSNVTLLFTLRKGYVFISQKGKGVVHKVRSILEFDFQLQLLRKKK